MRSPPRPRNELGEGGLYRTDLSTPDRSWLCDQRGFLKGHVVSPTILQSAELTEAQFNEISELVKSLCGINLHDGKKELVKARLNKRLRELQLGSFGEYIEYVRNDASGAELTAMLDALSTNLTSFFREADHFEHLAKEVIPRVVSNAEEAGRRLRIWSAGCSSGEEPYSIAITVCERIPDLGRWDAMVLATDISTRMVTRAKLGIYKDDRIKAISPQLRAKYLQCIEARPERTYRVNDSLQAIVHFARLNLMDAWPMRGPFNAIFCRNVMIYFDKPTQGRLIERFWDLLGPGGTLFIGHSESLTGVRHRFRYVRPTVYERS